MVPVSPNKKVIVYLDRKFQDIIVTPGGLRLWMDTSWRPGWHATVTGTVMSVPNALRNKYDLVEGDELAFNYLVVADQQYRDDRFDVFYEDAPIRLDLTTWSNKNGLTIARRYLFNNRWSVTVFDPEKTVYEHKEGDYDVVESVLGKYTFAETTDIFFSNCLPYNGRDFWMVDEGFLYAVRRGDKIIMLGDKVLLDVPKERNEGVTNNGIVLLSDRRDLGENEMHAKVAVTSERSGLNRGDEVVVDSRIVQRYTFWGKDYLLVRLDQIYALV